jgi:hypothetical protein
LWKKLKLGNNGYYWKELKKKLSYEIKEWFKLDQNKV